MMKYSLDFNLLKKDYTYKLEELILEIRKMVFFNNDVNKLIKKTINLINIFDKRKLEKKKLTEILIKEFKTMKNYLLMDLMWFFENDPSCANYNDILISYPGFLSIICYRYAHILYSLHINYLPRYLSEYAHSKTGIDISPGAEISHHFFIDHGTGVVIGETSVIGHHVKIYHGVTLGAISLNKGHKLKWCKRHPTIENYVTLYAGSTILGGSTIIHSNVTIGANVFVTESIPEKSVVIYQNNYQIIQKNK